ncbi:MAG TPA: acyl carrier protein [Firmicutes bacterium]|nr:acyl carrier protein [Bacillota bacterium]
MSQEIYDKVKKIIVREARVDESLVTLDATMNDLYADSATRMSIADELDREYNLGTLDVEIAEDTTVGDIVSYIREHLEDQE